MIYFNNGRWEVRRVLFSLAVEIYTNGVSNVD